MPKTWSRGGKILLAIFTMVAMTCAVVVFSSSRASAAVAHTDTPNPTCGTTSGPSNTHPNVCISAWSNGLTFNWSGYDPAVYGTAPEQSISYSGRGYPSDRT